MKWHFFLTSQVFESSLLQGCEISQFCSQNEFLFVRVSLQHFKDFYCWCNWATLRFTSLSSRITLRFTAFWSFNFLLSRQAFLWLVVHWFSLSSRIFVIIFKAGSTVFWTFLYCMTLFLIDLAVNFLFLQLATSELLLKTDKCFSHLMFLVGSPGFVRLLISKYLLLDLMIPV